jgi:hypothetical protein
MSLTPSFRFAGVSRPKSVEPEVSERSERPEEVADVRSRTTPQKRPPSWQTGVNPGEMTQPGRKPEARGFLTGSRTGHNHGERGLKWSRRESR